MTVCLLPPDVGLVKQAESASDHRFSVSKFKTFEKCNNRYRLQYIEKISRGDDFDFLIFGKFLHKILEEFQIALSKDSSLTWNQVMADAYKIGYKEFGDKLSDKDKSDAKQILSVYLLKQSALRKAGQLPKIIGTEQEFFILIDDCVLINGFIDLIQIDPDSVYHVIDYKSSKSKSRKYLEKDYFQLMTYAFYLCLKFPELEKIRVSYMMLRDDCELITKEYKRKEVMKMEKQFMDKAKKIQEEKLFRTTPGKLCEWCPFNTPDLCMDGHKFMQTKDDLW